MQTPKVFTRKFKTKGRIKKCMFWKCLFTVINEHQGVEWKNSGLLLCWDRRRHSKKWRKALYKGLKTNSELKHWNTQNREAKFHRLLIEGFVPILYISQKKNEIHYIRKHWIINVYAPNSFWIFLYELHN